MKRFAVCSERIPEEAAEKLTSRGFELIPLPPHPSLAEAVASHADMIFSVLDGTVFFDKIYNETYPETVERISRAGGYRKVLTDPLEKDYPRDAAHNVLVGKSFAAGHKSVSGKILDAVRSSGREFLAVKQGYAACSCLLAGDALVTADEGIAKALAKRCGVLKISPGYVRLDPYDAGFIGGASGFDGERAYFVGDISTHPDGEATVYHLSKYGVDTVSLGAGELLDIGGIKFI